MVDPKDDEASISHEMIARSKADDDRIELFDPDAVEESDNRAAEPLPVESEAPPDDGLQKLRKEKEDLTSWLEYSAEGLRTTLERVWTRIQQLSAHVGKTKLVLRPKQEQLLHLLRERKALTPREIWDGIGVSKQGALDLLKPLIKAGLIRRIGTRKTGRYVLR